MAGPPLIDCVLCRQRIVACPNPLHIAVELGSFQYMAIYGNILPYMAIIEEYIDIFTDDLLLIN